MEKSQINISQQFIKQPSYLYQRLLYHFIAQLDSDISPLSFAIGALLFKNDDIAALNKIYNYLDNILDNINQNPTGEPDLPNKTLMLVTYHHLCTLYGFQSHVPTDIINLYLQYSKNEQWFDSIELVYFVKYFASDFRIVSENILHYVNKIIATRLNEIKPFALCLVLLEKQAAYSDRQKFLEIINEQISNQIDTTDICWAIIAIKTLEKYSESNELSLELHVTENELIKQLLSRLEKNALPNEDEFNIVRILNFLSEHQTDNVIVQIESEPSSIIQKIDVQNNNIILTINEEILIEPIPSTILALSLWALRIVGYQEIYGIHIGKFGTLNKLISDAESSKDKKKIVVDRTMNYITNIMALLLVFFVGISYSAYKADILNLDFSKLTDIIEYWPIVIGTITIVVMGGIYLLKKGTIEIIFSKIPYIGDVIKTFIEKNTKE